MAKSKSWSVKGIDGETRDLARTAAQAAGMTIGAWIDQAILKAKHDALPEPTASGSATDVATTPDRSATPVGQDRPAPAMADPAGDGVPMTGSASEAPGSIEAEVAAPSQYVSAEASPAHAAENTQPDPVETPEQDATVRADQPTEDFYANAGVAEPMPIAPQPARTSPGRYAILGIALVAILAGGGWLYMEFSQQQETSAPERSARVQTPAADSTAPATPGQAAPAVSDAVREEIDLARAGDVKAQYNVAMRYLDGRGVKNDSAEAAKWFERSAVQGLADAQFNLGVLYQRGEGVAQDDRLAFFWYQSAADQGLPRAQHNLATAFAEGKGIARNYPKALEWFTKSANAGVGASQYSLAAIYESGLVTGKPDLAQARTWYEKAAAQGDTKATERLALMGEVPPADRTASTGATAPVPSTDTTTLKAVGRQEIREIQSLLARMNFNPGPADGQMGGKTADAIRLYQQFAGIEIDGVPSQELLDEMRAVASSMASGG